MGVALKNRSKVKKMGANLSFDILIFDPKSITHLYPKKSQIEQKVIIAFTECWKEIGLSF